MLAALAVGLGSGLAGLALGLRFEPLGRARPLAAAMILLPLGVALPGAKVLAAGAGFGLWTALLWTQLVALAWIDLRSRTLPDLLTAGLALTGAAHATLRLGDPWPMLATAAAALGAFAVFALLRWRGAALFGGGDVLLAGALGLWLGPAGLVAAVLWGLLLTAALRLALGTDPAPFAPGLAVASMAVWLFGPYLVA